MHRVFLGFKGKHERKQTEFPREKTLLTQVTKVIRFRKDIAFLNNSLRGDTALVNLKDGKIRLRTPKEEVKGLMTSRLFSQRAKPSYLLSSSF